MEPQFPLLYSEGVGGQGAVILSEDPMSQAQPWPPSPSPGGPSLPSGAPQTKAHPFCHPLCSKGARVPGQVSCLFSRWGSLAQLAYFSEVGSPLSDPSPCLYHLHFPFPTGAPLASWPSPGHPTHCGPAPQLGHGGHSEGSRCAVLGFHTGHGSLTTFPQHSHVI